MATMADVAREADVSTATVSRVLNNSMQVIPETRQRVLAAMEKLGYDYGTKRFAGGPISKKLILVMTNTTLPDILDELRKAAAEYGYQVIFNYYEPGDTSNIFDIVGSQISGVILLGVIDRGGALEAQLKNYPLVQLKAKRLQFKNNFVVMSDEAQMAYDAVQHLVGRGRRRIALVTVKQSPFIEPRRDSGYRQALSDAGVQMDKELIFYGDYTYDGGYDAAKAMVKSGIKPDGVFCICDMMAAGCMKYFREKGIRVPEDVAVVSLDNTEVAEFLTPPLTTVDACIGETAQEAVKLLDSVIRQEVSTGRTIIVEHRLVVREST